MTPVTVLGSLVTTLVLAGGGLVSPAQGATSYGHTHAADGRLRDGCRNYAYRYVIKTPSNDWSLETFLVDPDGETLSSGAFLSDSDPRRGDGVFRFCRYSTHAGRFTIRAKVHWYNRYNEERKAILKPSHFRLTRR